jgi:transcriptional regulator with XRE-family HTH domain
MNLISIRKARQLTQSELAALCGIASSVISNYECGVRDPSLKSLRKIREALDCTWDELCGYVPPQNSESKI